MDCAVVNRGVPAVEGQHGVTRTLEPKLELSDD